MENPAFLEQIAMYMVALPCPPLPVLVNVEKYEGFEEEDKADINEKNEAICSSHDLLAGLLISAMHRKNKTLNEQRKQKQLKTTENFIAELIDMNQKKSMDTEKMYEACQRFTYEYLQSFEDAEYPSPSVRFMNMDDVKIGDKVHKACCSWNIAQDMIHAKSDEAKSGSASKLEVRPKSVFEQMSFREMIQAHCHRVIEDDLRSNTYVKISESETSDSKCPAGLCTEGQ